MNELNRYRAARERVSQASEACVHWDYETRDDEIGAYECCRVLSNARKERELARKAFVSEAA